MTSIILASIPAVLLLAVVILARRTEERISREIRSRHQEIRSLMRHEYRPWTD